MNSTHIQTIRSALQAIRQNTETVATKINMLEMEILTAITSNNAALAEARVAPTLSLAEKIVAMLSGEYKLRTMQAITDQVGISRDNVLAALDVAEVSVKLLRRRDDGAELIGLSLRN